MDTLEAPTESRSVNCVQTASEEQSKEHPLFDEREREILCGLLRFCLKQLVDGEHAKQGDVVGRFHVNFDATGRLARSDQIAATVRNRMKMPVKKPMRRKALFPIWESSARERGSKNFLRVPRPTPSLRKAPMKTASLRGRKALILCLSSGTCSGSWAEWIR